VTITYADGVQEKDAGLMNMIAMGGPSGWRMIIGTDINPGPAGPPPAVASPPRLPVGGRWPMNSRS
jgi:hypothetical protein